MLTLNRENAKTAKSDSSATSIPQFALGSTETILGADSQQETLTSTASFLFEGGPNEVWISRSKEGSEVDIAKSSPPSSSYSSSPLSHQTSFSSLRLPSPTFQTFPSSPPTFAPQGRLASPGEPARSERENAHLACRLFGWRKLQNWMFRRQSPWLGIKKKVAMYNVPYYTMSVRPCAEYFKEYF